LREISAVAKVRFGKRAFISVDFPTPDAPANAEVFPSDTSRCMYSASGATPVPSSEEVIKVGIPTFVTSSEAGEGIEALEEYIRENVTCGKTSAFAGASGVGKSTLMNTLFPTLTLATAEISRKIERGRHTTRHVEIFDIDSSRNTGFLADTPGFSLIDFARFDFFGLDELLPTFPELLPYVGSCRYADCAHVGEGEDECAVAKACSEGKIAPTRLESYRSIYRVLKDKNAYK
jgi:ribosome biogenesis GTPase